MNEVKFVAEARLTAHSSTRLAGVLSYRVLSHFRKLVASRYNIGPRGIGSVGNVLAAISSKVAFI